MGVKTLVVVAYKIITVNPLAIAGEKRTKASNFSLTVIVLKNQFHMYPFLTSFNCYLFQSFPKQNANQNGKNTPKKRSTPSISGMMDEASYINNGMMMNGKHC